MKFPARTRSAGVNKAMPKASGQKKPPAKARSAAVAQGQPSKTRSAGLGMAKR